MSYHQTPNNPTPREDPVNILLTPTRVYRRREPTGAAMPTVVDDLSLIVIRRRSPVAVSPIPLQMPVAVAPSRRVAVTPEPVEIPVSTKPAPVMPKLPRASAVEIALGKWPLAVQSEQLPRTAPTMNWSQPATQSASKRSSKRNKFARKVAGLQRQLLELAEGVSNEALELTRKLNLPSGVRENIERVWSLRDLERAIARLSSFAVYEALRQLIAFTQSPQMRLKAAELAATRQKTSLQALA